MTEPYDLFATLDERMAAAANATQTKIAGTTMVLVFAISFGRRFADQA